MAFVSYGRWILFRCSILVCLISGSLLTDAFSAELPVKRVAVVRDGASPFFDKVLSGARKELKELADGQYRFEVLDDFNARGNPARVEAELLRALRDPKVDVVYAAGIVATMKAQQLPAALRTKPIVGGAIEFSDFNNEGVSPDGTSKIPNFTFILEPRRIQADLSELARLSGKRVIYSFVDSTVIHGIGKDLTPRLAQLNKTLNVDLRIVPAGNTASACLAALPKAARAVYIPILPSLREGERKKIFAGLTQRKIMHLSMQGVGDVTAGAMASLSPGDPKPLLRRTAINLHQIFSGVPTKLLPVVLRSNDRLSINMHTAQRIGWSPGYDTILTAEVIQMDAMVKNSGSMNLEKAMRIASSRNVDVRVAKQRWMASYWETQSAKTARYPQITASGQWSHQGLSNPINPLAQPNTDTFSLGAEISQLIYSDRITSQIRAQQEVTSATELDMESVRLDSIETAGKAYLDCLLAEALYRIEKENVTLLRQNLNLAQTRRDIGAADASEVFRWQASLAQGKSQLIQQDSARKNAHVALNVAISKPRSAHWKLADIKLADDDFFFMNKVLSSRLKTLAELEKYSGFVKALSSWRAPELRALEKNLSAQGILLVERGRRHRRPEIKLTASGRHALTEVSQKYDNQTEWSVGIGFSFPLFEGGLKKTETARIRAVIRQISAQRDQALYVVEQRALANVFSASANHPSLRLSRRAREAAEKNYASVKTKYSQGAATIIDLLDAQSELLNQKRAVAQSKYQYLKDTIAIQRSIAWFEFSKTPKQKAEWERMLRNYLTTGSLHITLKK